MSILKLSFTHNPVTPAPAWQSLQGALHSAVRVVKQPSGYDDSAGQHHDQQQHQQLQLLPADGRSHTDHEGLPGQHAQKQQPAAACCSGLQPRRAAMHFHWQPVQQLRSSLHGLSVARAMCEQQQQLPVQQTDIKANLPRPLHEIWGNADSNPHNSSHCSGNISSRSTSHARGLCLQQGWLQASNSNTGMARSSSSSSSCAASWHGSSSSSSCAASWHGSSFSSSRGFARRAVAANTNAARILEELNKLREDDALQSSLTPAAVVDRLDKVIIGQEDAKRAVAIAFRNRWRRQRVADPEMQREITPKNLLLIGPTGCGKTEIARRLAKLAEAPFIKVEATKFTEVGYHGRDVDQIVRDLVEAAVALVKKRCKKAAAKVISEAVEQTIVAALLAPNATAEEKAELRRKYRAGELDQERVSVDVPPQQRNGGDGPGFVVQGGSMSVSFSMMAVPPGGFMSGSNGTERRSMSVAEARELLEDVEAESVLPADLLSKEAVRVAEEEGIVFIDEIDKIVNPSGTIRHGSDPSAEGVQRDLLPLIEGSVISTKHGQVATDHILFIASGAFTAAKPSDMMAELQGRLPIRVELRGLTAADFERILTEPACNMIYQQQRLLGCEGVKLEFTAEAIKEIAAMTEQVNKEVENIGARRLHTVLERLVEDISFEAPDKVEEVQQVELDTAAARDGRTDGQQDEPLTTDLAVTMKDNKGSYTYVIDKQQVKEKLNSLLQQEDFNKYIL